MAAMPHVTAIRQGHLGHEERAPIPVRFYHLVWIFFVCSFVGLVGETVVSFIVDGHWESRAGFVVGPLSPIYGVGAVIFTLFVNPLRAHKPIVQFLAAALMGGLFEYLAGWFFETCYGIVAWSYIDQPFNLHGHTCLGIALVWGAIGLVWTLRVLPVVVNLINRMPERTARRVAGIMFAFLLVDVLLTLGALDCWFLRTAGNAADTSYQQFFATYFNDSFMQKRFETMSMWPVLASR